MRICEDVRSRIQFNLNPNQKLYDKILLCEKQVLDGHAYVDHDTGVVTGQDCKWSCDLG